MYPLRPTFRCLVSASLQDSNMQEREINRATIGVAKRRDISGQATADEINRGLRTAEKKSFWSIASFTFLGSLTVAGLFVALAPLPAHADNDQDSRHGSEDSDKGIRAEITALEAQVTSLQATVSALQDQVNKLQTSNTGLQNQVNSLQASITLLSRIIDLLRKCRAAIGTAPGRSQQPRPDRFQDLLQRQTRSFFLPQGKLSG
jgi:septal ring factor EnvC (AmiA/AmiB activator)